MKADHSSGTVYLFFFFKERTSTSVVARLFFCQFYNRHVCELILHLSNLQSRASRATAQIASYVQVHQHQNRESGKLFHTVSKKI